MSRERAFARDFKTATQASVQLAVRGVVQQVEFLNGLLKNAQQNIKSLQDKIKTLTTERDSARSNEEVALRLLSQEQDRNTELLAKMAELQAENNLLKAQYDQSCTLFS